MNFFWGTTSAESSYHKELILMHKVESIGWTFDSTYRLSSSAFYGDCSKKIVAETQITTIDLLRIDG